MRYYMKRSPIETAGDPSSNFSFISFLPMVIKDQVAPFADLLYSYASDFGIVPNFLATKTGTMLDKTTTYEKQK